jgi:hypothetical protein
MTTFYRWVSALCLVLMMGFAANAQAQPVITIGNVSGSVGQLVDIPVDVTTSLTGVAAPGGVLSMDFYINYDRNLLFIYDVEYGSVVTGSENVKNNLIGGQKTFFFSAIRATPFTGTGRIATLKARILAGGSNATGLSFGAGTVYNGSNAFNTGTGSINTTGGNLISVSIPVQNQLANTNSISVPVNISDLNRAGIFSYRLRLNFNPALFTITGASNAGGAYSHTPTFVVNSPGVVTINGVLSNGIALSTGANPGGAGALVNLVLNTLGTNVTNSPLTFDMSFTRLDEGSPAAIFNNSTVTISTNNPVPTIASVTPNSVLAGAAATPITVTGTNYVANSVIRVNGVDISTNFVNGTTLTGTIPAPSLANAAVLNIGVFNPLPAGGFTNPTIPFTVGNPAPVPTNMSVGVYYWGPNTNVTVNGTAIFNGATLNAGSGVTFSNYNYSGEPTSVSFNATVAPGTTLGVRSLTIQNTGSATANIPGDVDIRYKAPTFASITPISAVQGTTLNVIITGNDFFDVMTVKTALNMGAGITINSVTIDSQNQLTANITVAGDALVGTRDITLSNAVNGSSGGSDTESAAFSVILSGNPIPTLSTITPNNGRQGESVNVQLIGTNFGTLFTSVSFGSDITVTNITVPSSTTINVTLNIGNNAVLGQRNVTVTNAGPGGGVAAINNGFTVNPPANTAPVASNDQYQTAFNTFLQVNSPGILQNDTDDGGIANLTAEIVSGLTPASAGTLNFSFNGGFTFTPTQGFSGNATFTYRAKDDQNLTSNVATVTIVVGSNVNSVPIANSDNYNTAFNTRLLVPAPGFLSNDIDDGGIANLTAAVVNTAPGNVGSILIGANGSIDYTPADGYSGTFEFTYRATDAQNAQSNLATVRITVTGLANATPTANNDNYTVAAGTTLNVTAPGILANDTDDGGVVNLTVELIQTQNINGSFNLNSNGSFVYSPIPTFFGISSFTYRAKDAQGASSNIATVTIVVGLAAPTHNTNWPAGQNQFVSTSPLLSFNPVTGAQYYDVQVSKSTDFGPDQTYDACYPDCGGVLKMTSAEANTLTFTTFNPSVVANGLKATTQYYWRARAAAQNGTVKGPWSEVRSFITVAKPFAPTLALPNNNDVGIPAAAPLSWLASAGATSYNVQVSINPNFDVLLVDSSMGNTAFTTPALSGGPVFFWRVRAIGIGGTSDWSEVRKFTRAALVSIGDDDTGIPTEYSLDQNYPNPFNPSTTISFRLPESADVTLQVINLHGQIVGTIMQNVAKNAGIHTVSFDASKLSSGVYIYRIVAGNFTASQKMVLVK